MATRKLFNSWSQKVEDADFTVDTNNEIVATFKDGSFIKFPAGLNKDEFEKLIKLHQVHNEGKEIITPEMEAAKDAERAASLKLIEESQASDVPQEN